MNKVKWPPVLQSGSSTNMQKRDVKLWSDSMDWVLWVLWVLASDFLSTLKSMGRTADAFLTNMSRRQLSDSCPETGPAKKRRESNCD